MAGRKTGILCESWNGIAIVVRGRRDAKFPISRILVHYVVDEIRLQHVSPQPVSGQCDKQTLLGALCPVQSGDNMGCSRQLSPEC